VPAHAHIDSLIKIDCDAPLRDLSSVKTPVETEVRMASIRAGLEGVVVAETELSDVDGENGVLVVRGFDIEELVGHASFEDVCALLWEGHLPGAAEREDYRAQLARSRKDAFALLPALGSALDRTDGMDALRAALAHLSPANDFLRDEVALAGATAVFAAAWGRGREGKRPIPPDPALSHAADYLAMLGAELSHARVASLDAYLCCVVDHGLNASTFAARVVASTGSDLVSAVVAGIGALKGPLHGGAPGPVLDMLDAIGSAERAHPWLERELEAGRRIMGMGHRVYRVRDPRAAALERALTRLLAAGGGDERLVLARAVEREAEALLAERHPDRRLRANVEFYTAVLLEAIGIPRHLFTPTFAVARVVGWCAHYAEQVEKGRLMRPLSRYIGTRPVPASSNPASLVG
jgi:citrate synthase